MRMTNTRPVPLLMAGAACTAASAACVELSQATAGTAAFARCALALLILVPLAVREHRRLGPRPARLRRLDLTAGLLLGVDYVLWAASIPHVGTGVATVLINVQVLAFPLLTRAVSGTRLPLRFLLMVPLMLTGVALAGGVLGQAGPSTGDPATGVFLGMTAGLAYAGYLFLMRLGGARAHTAYPVCLSTASAAVAAAALGSFWDGGIDLALGWSAWAWLATLAFFGQALAWLLVSSALPRLAPDVGAAVLLLQPVLALALGALALGERPAPTQLAGCALVITTVWYSGRSGVQGARPRKVSGQPAPEPYGEAPGQERSPSPGRQPESGEPPRPHPPT